MAVLRWRATCLGDGMHPLFEGVFLGGFECASQRLENGRRLDALASTRHDALARSDYARLRSLGMTTCRDGIAWPTVERRAGIFDFSVARKMARAARDQSFRVIWDLVRFGWPDDVDPFAPHFPLRFARYAGAAARMLRDEGIEAPWLVPIDEVSFLATAGADLRAMNPFEVARGVELKAQLVRATIEAIETIRAIAPRARFVQPERLGRVVPAALQPKTWPRVTCDNVLQLQAWDMLAGKMWPIVGGHPSYLDVIGVDFACDHQVMLDGTILDRHDERFTPLSQMLLEIHRRYGRPMIVGATGLEGEDRVAWLRYVCGECERALGAGCELHAIVIHPIVDGLFEHTDALGQRAVHEPLLEEMRRQTGRLVRARARMLEEREQVAEGGWALSV